MTDARPGPRAMRSLMVLLAAVAVVLAACSGGGNTASGGGGQVTLKTIWMKQAAYSDDEVKGMIKAFEDANPNIKVDTEFVQYESLHDKIVTAQSTGAGQYDTVLMDTPWPAEFADAQIVRDITDKIPADFKSGVFESAFTGANYNGKTWGVPWINDTKFFFYNKKMFQQAGIANPPKTWDEVVADAKTIKAKGIVQYPLAWSWVQAEAVICDWAEIAAVMGGANFVDDQGNPTFNKGGGLAALQFMKQTIDDGITNPASLGFVETDVNSTIAAGKAAMGLNWTFGYNVLNDKAQSKVAGDIAVTAAPGGPSAATSGVNGGMSIAVTTKSQHPDEALKLALWMASQPMQEKYDANTFPEWKASFDKTDLTKGNPEFWAAAKSAFAGLVARPIVPYYTNLSNALQAAIQEALKGTKTPQQALDEVAAKVPDMKK